MTLSCQMWKTTSSLKRGERGVKLHQIKSSRQETQGCWRKPCFFWADELSCWIGIKLSNLASLCKSCQLVWPEARFGQPETPFQDFQERLPECDLQTSGSSKSEMFGVEIILTRTWFWVGLNTNMHQNSINISTSFNLLADNTSVVLLIEIHLRFSISSQSTFKTVLILSPKLHMFVPTKILIKHHQILSLMKVFPTYFLSSNPIIDEISEGIHQTSTNIIKYP